MSVVAAFSLKHCQRTLPERKCSQVYQRYAHVEGIQAAYVKDYRINDSMTVAVTLLEATDSAGWERLADAFNITQEMRATFGQVDMDMVVWQSFKDTPEIRATTKGYGRDTSLTRGDLVLCACSLKGNKICIFHTQNEDDVMAVSNYNYDNMINNTNF